MAPLALSAVCKHVWAADRGAIHESVRSCCLHNRASSARRGDGGVSSGERFYVVDHSGLMTQCVQMCEAALPLMNVEEQTEEPNRAARGVCRAPHWLSQSPIPPPACVAQMSAGPLPREHRRPRMTGVPLGEGRGTGVGVSNDAYS